MRVIDYSTKWVKLTTLLIVGFGVWILIFRADLFAGALAMLMSMAIGILLVDRLMARDARAKWKLIEGQTLDSIYHYLEDIHFACMTTSPLMRVGGSKHYTSFGDYAQSAVANARDLTSAHRPGEESDEASSVALYRKVEPALGRLRDVLAPRVISYGYEPELASALLAVESAERNWRSSISLVKVGLGAPEGCAWEAVGAFLQECAKLKAELERACRTAGISPTNRLDHSAFID